MDVLVMNFDVTGWSDQEILSLEAELTAQIEATDGHPESRVVRTEVLNGD